MSQLGRSLSAHKGSTLNEILVAMALIGIALVGYGVSTVSFARGNRQSVESTAAVNLAQDKLAQLRAKEFVSPIDTCPDSGEMGLSAAGVSGGGFNRCWRIAESQLGPNLKQLEVTVSWRDTVTRSVSLVTLVYRD